MFDTHRIKTHAPGWTVEQLPGHRYLWTTPHGRALLVDGTGTTVVERRPAGHSALEQGGAGLRRPRPRRLTEESAPA
jgi:hypothetical protein